MALLFVPTPPAAAGAAETPSPTLRSVTIVNTWRANLRAAARSDPNRRFPNPSTATLRRRLRLAAGRYHFSVLKIEILRPRQAAPLVVVQAADKRALSAAIPAILHLIDPKRRTNDDRTGWAYEGFLFEARDNRGIPFLATFNWWRGPHPGGGQWASDPNLLPFAHG